MAIGALSAAACSRPVSHQLLDTYMGAVHRPNMTPFRVYPPLDPAAHAAEATDPGGPSPRYELLAGDFHCHVAPPDRPPHVSRGLDETVALAEEEGLDFVVLTPHVRAKFFLGEWSRERTVTGLTDLAKNVAKASAGKKTTFIVGFEYTDFAYGHVGAAFADLNAVLAAVPIEEAVERPARFFEEYVARGGLITINHPLLVPVESAISVARWDLSWKPFTEPDESYPDEIMAAGRLAQGMEVFNLAMFELRDRILLFDSHLSTRDTFARLDQEIVQRGRRMVPIGGSDSHSGHLRATTFVLSRGRTPEAIREAVLAGRVCVRDPAACSFAVRAEGGRWAGVGSALMGVSSVRARASGTEAQVLVNGRVIDMKAPREGIDIQLDPGKCSVLRARVDEGYSAPIYANCKLQSLAEPAP